MKKLRRVIGARMGHALRRACFGPEADKAIHGFMTEYMARDPLTPPPLSHEERTARAVRHAYLDGLRRGAQIAKNCFENELDSRLIGG